MLTDIVRFFRRANRDLAAGSLGELTLGQYVERVGSPPRLLHDYLVPMGAAIWSAAPARVLHTPAAFILGFFAHHGMLSVEAGPRWQHIRGGSRVYVEAIRQALGHGVLTDAAVAAIARTEAGVVVHRADGTSLPYDYAVVATHADTALALLSSPTPHEARHLGAWRYQANHAVLHTDCGVMPSNRAVWASWNYHPVRASGDEEAPVLTYHLNRLQGHLGAHHAYFLSLNLARPVEPGRVLAEFAFTHPCYDAASVASREALKAANGALRTYFCGSYFGNGFHEDAIRSGAEVAAAFGCPLGAR